MVIGNLEKKLDWCLSVVFGKATLVNASLAPVLSKDSVDAGFKTQNA